MQECKQCLYTQMHPFGLEFKDGVCTGCITHNEKNSLDWELRYRELAALLSGYKKSGQTYDCIVPVTGDAEDFYVVSTVIEHGLRPLIVCVNDYFKNDIGWQNLHQLITYFDVDSICYNPNQIVYRELVKTSFRKFNHVLMPFHLLHTAFPVHVALQRKIKLIIWGQHQAVEQVGKFSHLDNVEMSEWSRFEHDLWGTDVDTLIGTGAQVLTTDLKYYHYPEKASISAAKIRGIYLNNFLPWDPLSQNSRMLKFGFNPQFQSSTFDPYERAGSSVYYGIHDLSKFMRRGYFKILDHFTREIRHKRITKSEAQTELDKWNNTYNLKPFFEWLGVSETGYQWLLKHRFHDVRNLIVEEDQYPGTNKLKTQTLLDFCPIQNIPSRDFVIFGKGI